MASYTDEKLIKIIENIISFSTSNDMKEIFHKNNNLYRKTLIDKYPEFSKDCPGLFNTIIDNPKKFDMNRLQYMLNMRNKIKNNEISQTDADKKLGQEYFDEYVKPKIDNKIN
jgi:hypothetical protein